MADLSELIKELSEEQQKAVMAQFEAVNAQKDKQINTLQAQMEEKQKQINQFSEKEIDINKQKEDIVKLQEQLKNAQEKHATEIKQMQYESAAKDATGELHFSSKGAKKVFLAGLNQETNPLVDGKIQGFDDYVKQYKAEDPGAFVEAAPVSVDTTGKTETAAVKSEPMINIPGANSFGSQPIPDPTEILGTKGEQLLQERGILLKNCATIVNGISEELI